MSRYQVDMCEAPKVLSLNVTAAHHSALDQGEDHSHVKNITCYEMPCSLRAVLQLCDS